ncbi:MAG: hypothetical protein HN348_20540 [Proteobacteria bacterium]|nr:hypothetical protein [Pseudomonadota bacterium]
MDSYNDNLLKTIRLTQEMLALADEGDRDRNDVSCGIIYGILRDTAYRLRKLATEECHLHRQAGKWDDEHQMAQKETTP